MEERKGKWNKERKTETAEERMSGRTGYLTNGRTNGPADGRADGQRSEQCFEQLADVHGGEVICGRKETSLYMKSGCF